MQAPLFNSAQPRSQEPLFEAGWRWSGVAEVRCARALEEAKELGSGPFGAWKLLSWLDELDAVGPVERGNWRP